MTVADEHGSYGCWGWDTDLTESRDEGGFQSPETAGGGRGSCESRTDYEDRDDRHRWQMHADSLEACDEHEGLRQRHAEGSTEKHEAASRMLQNRSARRGACGRIRSTIARSRCRQYHTPAIVSPTTMNTAIGQ